MCFFRIFDYRQYGCGHNPIIYQEPCQIAKAAYTTNGKKPPCARAIAEYGGTERNYCIDITPPEPEGKITLHARYLNASAPANWDTCDIRNKDVFLKQGVVYEMTACEKCTSPKIGESAQVVDWSQCDDVWYEEVMEGFQDKD